MKKIRRCMAALLPYLLILLILAGGLGGSFLLIRHAPVYDASIVRHDTPLENRLLFVDAKEPLLLYPWDRIDCSSAERYTSYLRISEMDELSRMHLSTYFNNTVRAHLRMLSSIEAADDVFFDTAMFDASTNFVYIKDLVFRSRDSEYVLSIVLRHYDQSVVYYHCAAKDRVLPSDDKMIAAYENINRIFGDSPRPLIDVFEKYNEYLFGSEDDLLPPENAAELKEFDFLITLKAYLSQIPSAYQAKIYDFATQNFETIAVNIISYNGELLLYFSCFSGRFTLMYDPIQEMFTGISWNLP